MSIKLKGNNESTFAQNIKTAKQVEVSDGIKFGDGTVQTTAATSGGGGDSSGSGADAWGTIEVDGTLSGGFNVTTAKGGSGDDKGIYEVTFITPMPNANYAIMTPARAGDSDSDPRLTAYKNKTSTGFTIYRYRIDQSSGGVGSNGPSSFAVFASNAIAPEAGVGADAWGVVNGDGTLLSGYNVTSSVYNDPGQYQINFNTPMPIDTYSVVATTNAGASLTLCTITGQTVNGFVVRTVNNENQYGNYSFNFTVHASSTITPTFTWTRQGTTLLPANAADDVNVTNSVYAGTVQANGGANSNGINSAESFSKIPDAFIPLL